MSDPRERIETENLQCASREKAGLIEGFYRLSGFAPWPEVVEFCEKILAADAEWREQNAPTLAELRAKYPGAMVEITPLRIPGDDYLARLVTESVSVEHAAPTVGHALEWLAAKLAEGGTDGA